MPKNEFDFEDPLELNGMAFPTSEDTTDAMCECFIEEFMRMGYSACRIYTLFRNPHYIGMNMVWEKRGEPFVRDAISELFARWGRPVTWPAEPAAIAPEMRPSAQDTGVCPMPQAIALDEEATDPMGAPVPKINL